MSKLGGNFVFRVHNPKLYFQRIYIANVSFKAGLCQSDFTDTVGAPLVFFGLCAALLWAFLHCCQMNSMLVCRAWVDRDATLSANQLLSPLGYSSSALQHLAGW